MGGGARMGWGWGHEHGWETANTTEEKDLATTSVTMVGGDCRRNRYDNMSQNGG